MGRVADNGTRALRTLVTAILAVGLGFGLVGGTAAAATPAAKSTDAKVAKVKDATLAWGVSKYVLGANPAVTSLSESARAEAPATFTVGTGWQFSAGTGSFDPKTKATTATFDGAIEFGNTNSGNYGFKLSDPTVTFDAAGNGTVSADVALRPVGGGPFAAPSRIDVATISGAVPTATKKRATVTVTPTAFADSFLA